MSCSKLFDNIFYVQFYAGEKRSEGAAEPAEDR